MTTPILTGIMPHNLYEYGTFTPSVGSDGVSGSISYTGQTGSYFKQGKIITLNVMVSGSITGSPTGNFLLNLPINASFNPSTINYSGTCTIFSNGGGAHQQATIVVINGNPSRGYFFHGISNIVNATGNFQAELTLSYGI